MIRTAYLHVGAPKAGSKSIQGFLASHRAALLERRVETPDFGHGEIVTGALALTGGLKTERDTRQPRTASWKWLDARLATTETDLCVSREQFAAHIDDPRQLAFAREFFETRGLRVKLIGYVRDHVGYLNAAYTQQAKKLRLTEGFEAWAAQVVASPPRRYCYWRMFRPALMSDGLEVVIRPLNEVAEGGLIEAFCAEIDRPDLDVSSFDGAPYRNETPGSRAIAASLLVGRALAELKIDPDGQPHLARVLKEGVARRGWRERPFFGPDAETAGRLAAAYAEADERFARKAWGVSWRDRVPPTRKAPNRFDLSRASIAERAEIDDLVREVIDRATARPLMKRLFGAFGLTSSRVPSAPSG